MADERERTMASGINESNKDPSTPVDSPGCESVLREDAVQKRLGIGSLLSVLLCLGLLVLGALSFTRNNRGEVSVKPPIFVNLGDHDHNVMGFMSMLGTDYKGSMYFDPAVVRTQQVVLGNLAALYPIGNSHGAMTVIWLASGSIMLGLMLGMMALVVRSIMHARKGALAGSAGLVPSLWLRVLCPPSCLLWLGRE